jgi:hypothetical protein
MMECINANNGIALASKIKNAWTNYMYAVDDLYRTMDEEGSKHPTALNDEMHDKTLISKASDRATRCHSYGLTLIANLLAKGWRGQETRTIYRRRGDSTYGDYIFVWDDDQCRQYTRGPISEVDDSAFESWYNILIAAKAWSSAKSEYDRQKEKAIKFNDEMYESIARDEDALASIQHKNNRHDNLEKKRLQMNIDWYLSRIVEIPD